MERKKFLKQNSQNKWQKRGLEDNYFKLPFSQNILPKILRIFAKNVECAQPPCKPQIVGNWKICSKYFFTTLQNSNVKRFGWTAAFRK
nr:MAG TPA: hypothetical protein [Caudoviricetes sp.]